MKPLKAFELEVNGKVLDHRVGKALDLDSVRAYFTPKYEVGRLWNAGRHVLAHLTQDGKDYFLKLATSEGISAVTKNEYFWNDVFNKQIPRDTSDFWVPVNHEEGWFTKERYYFIADTFSGTPLADRPEPGTVHSDFSVLLPDIIRLSERIGELSVGQGDMNEDYREIFMKKVTAWYDAIPDDVKNTHRVEDLLTVVHHGSAGLTRRPRHGDYTPWHMLKLSNGKLGLIDGEHYLPHSVEYYDIGYFIQRVFTILDERQRAEELYRLLVDNNYNQESLRVILAARGIGGYLDASLAPVPDYESTHAFQTWLLEAI